MTIQTIKTWHGRKHCIVDENKNIIELSVNGLFSKMAVYPHTSEGLSQARAKLAELKN